MTKNVDTSTDSHSIQWFDVTPEKITFMGVLKTNWVFFLGFLLVATAFFLWIFSALF